MASTPKDAIPTKANLERKPQAIVVQQFLTGNAADKVAALEFEWFETDTGRIAYYDEIVVWSRQDVDAHGDVLYAWAEVTDTATMTLGRIAAAGKSKEWEAAAIKAIKADPLIALIAQPDDVAKKAAPRVKAGVKATIKPRKASAAAGALKGPVEATDATPVVKPKIVRKRLEATATAPAPSADASDKRAAALKARLAAKKAEAAPEVTADAENIADVDASVVGPKTD